MIPEGTAYGFLAFFFAYCCSTLQTNSGELLMTTTRARLQAATLSSKFSITQAWFSIIFSLLEKAYI